MKIEVYWPLYQDSQNDFLFLGKGCCVALVYAREDTLQQKGYEIYSIDFYRFSYAGNKGTLAWEACSKSSEGNVNKNL